MRMILYEAAQVMLVHLAKWSWLKAWAMKIAKHLLAPVYGWFTEGFDTLDLKETKTLLEELHARICCGAWGGSWPKATNVDRAEHVRSARVFQTSTCSAIARASSTSMPRYLTVLSIFVWPSKSCTARRLPVRR